MEDVIEAGKEFSEVQRSLALGKKLGKVVYMEEHRKSSPYTQTSIFVPSIGAERSCLDVKYEYLCTSIHV